MQGLIQEVETLRETIHKLNLKLDHSRYLVTYQINRIIKFKNIIVVFVYSFNGEIYYLIQPVHFQRYSLSVLNLQIIKSFAKYHNLNKLNENHSVFFSFHFV